MIFLPPLQSTTHVSTPAVSRTGVVRVVLRVRLADEHFSRLERDGVRIEVWTDMPIEGKEESHWGPQAFKEVKFVETSREDEGHSLRLCSTDLHADAQQSGEHEMRATFWLPDCRRMSFSFTYRLVYPSGHIDWIGTDAQNGVLEVVPDGGLFAEEKGWSEDSDGFRMFTADNSDSGDVVTGQIDVESSTWSCWAVFGTSVTRFTLPSSSRISRASTLVLVPHISHDAVLTPQPVIFHATSDGSAVSISPTGTVVFHPSGQSTLERRIYTPDPNHDLHLQHAQLSTSCSKPKILSNSAETLVLSPHHEPDTPSTIYLLPLSAEIPSGGWRVKLPIASLSQFTPNSACASFFCNDTMRSVFVDLFDTDVTELTLVVGKHGGEFVMSPAYAIAKDGAWQIAFPSVLSSVPEIVKSSPPTFLPTPPASPPPTETRTIFSYIEDAAADNDTPDVNADRSSPNGSGSGARALSAQRWAGLSPRLRQLLSALHFRAYLLSAFTISTMFLGMIFQRVLGLPPARPVSPERGSGSMRDGKGDAREQQQPLIRKGEAKAPSHEARVQPPIFSTAEEAPRKMGEGSAHREAKAGASRTPKPTLGDKAVGGSERKEQATIFRCDVPSAPGVVRFLLKCEDVQPGLEHVRVKVDGLEVIPSVQAIDRQTTLFEHETSTSGKLEIQLAV